jgi:hypothetical protein
LKQNDGVESQGAVDKNYIDITTTDRILGYELFMFRLIDGDQNHNVVYLFDHYDGNTRKSL